MSQQNIEILREHHERLNSLNHTEMAMNLESEVVQKRRKRRHKDRGDKDTLAGENYVNLKVKKR